jgi:N-acetylneuraminic acid mutarotase
VTCIAEARPAGMEGGSTRHVVSWSMPVVNGSRIPARGGHSCVLAGSPSKLLVVFGGHFLAAKDKFGYLNDVWVLQLSSMSWKAIRCGGLAPEPRYGHGCELIGNRMFIIGGKGANQELYRDVYFLDLESWEWSKVNPISTGPSPRMGHATVAVGRKIVVHGGWNGRSECFDDIWVFDTDTFTWMNPRVSGLPPPPVYGHCLTLLHDRRILLVGGASLSEKTGVPKYRCELRQLDTETMAWSKPWINGYAPSGRYGHCLCQCWGAGQSTFNPEDDGASDVAPLLLFGGWGEQGIQEGGALKGSSQACVIEMESDSQALAIDVPVLGSSSQTLPPSRHGHTATHADDTICVFGGWDGQQATNDLIMIRIRRK